MLLQDCKDGEWFGHARDAVSGDVADVFGATAEAATDFCGVMDTDKGACLGCDVEREGGFVVLILLA